MKTDGANNMKRKRRRKERRTKRCYSHVDCLHLYSPTYVYIFLYFCSCSFASADPGSVWVSNRSYCPDQSIGAGILCQLSCSYFLCPSQSEGWGVAVLQQHSVGSQAGCTGEPGLTGFFRKPKTVTFTSICWIQTGPDLTRTIRSQRFFCLFICLLVLLSLIDFTGQSFSLMLLSWKSLCCCSIRVAQRWHRFIALFIYF